LPQQQADVLDGGDQPVLNLHPPESSPPGPFETVMVGRVGKAGLGQVLATLAISSGGGTVGLVAGSIQQVIATVSLWLLFYLTSVIWATAPSHFAFDRVR
jgi:hypothetical protein